MKREEATLGGRRESQQRGNSRIVHLLSALASTRWGRERAAWWRTGNAKMLLLGMSLAGMPLAACACGHNGEHCPAMVSVPEKQTYEPGDTVPQPVVDRTGADSFFTCTAIPDSVFALMRGRSYKANCTVPRKSLRYLRCLHRDKDGNILVGEMVVNRSVAADVLGIFRQLYEAAYPIERMRLIDYWDADDERAMRMNNSSCFNFRFISHTTKVSKHGKGMAIDINTLYNPYHKTLPGGKVVTEPATGKPYLDRSASFPYKIVKGDLCYRLFKAKGFRWGGEWANRKDYQHFEK